MRQCAARGLAFGRGGRAAQAEEAHGRAQLEVFRLLLARDGNGLAKAGRGPVVCLGRQPTVAVPRLSAQHFALQAVEFGRIDPFAGPLARGQRVGHAAQPRVYPTLGRLALLLRRAQRGIGQQAQKIRRSQFCPAGPELPQAVPNLSHAFAGLALCRLRPAVEHGAHRQPVRKTLLAGEVHHGAGMFAGRVGLVA